MTLSNLSALAYDAKIDGIYYNFSGDEAEVTYQNCNEEYYYCYSDYSGVINIPETITYNDRIYSVTSIGNEAFSGCSGLTSINIPNSVTSIGYAAFGGCSGLVSVTIGSRVTSIGRYAFGSCTSLTSISIPSSVTSIGESAFSGCSGLTAVIIPNSVVYIGEDAFLNCTNLQYNEYGYACYLGNNDNPYLALVKAESTDITNCIISEGCRFIFRSAFFGCNVLLSVNIPSSVTSIGNMAFLGCSSLTSVTIPNGVTSIGEYTFRSCSGLTSINIPNSVTSIGYEAFAECSCLTSIDIPNSVISIGAQAFRGCSGLVTVSIGSRVTSIGNGTFYNCGGLTSVIIGRGVTSIGGFAFNGCSKLTSITIPENVTNIGGSAFYGCSGLTSIAIPESVTSIGSNAFNGCKLRNVLIKCTTPPTGGAAFSEQTYYHTTLYVPVGSWDAYAYDENWYRFINIRETAISQEQLSMQQAYTLMDASTFTYSVYDPVNNCIGTISSVGIDENNPNHSWQIIEAGGARYLYNIGAKKYVKRNGDSLDLTDTPEPIEVEDGDNGIILGSQTTQQWALVSNERMSVAQNVIDEVTAIASPFGETKVGAVYSLSGQCLSKPQKGINIIGGKKVVIK